MDSQRRSVLTAVVAATALGGCLGNRTDDGTPSSDDEPEDESDGDRTATAEETEAPTPTETPETEPTGTPVSDADETVLVASDGSFAFDPQELRIASGTTVAFVWKGSGHNVAVTDQPADAAWAGVSEVQDTGYEHRNTFEVAGAYDYVCEPHEFAGMTGRIVVGDGA